MASSAMWGPVAILSGDAFKNPAGNLWTQLMDSGHHLDDTFRT